jgi:hypothetical protein
LRCGQSGRPDLCATEPTPVLTKLSPCLRHRFQRESHLHDNIRDNPPHILVHCLARNRSERQSLRRMRRKYTWPRHSSREPLSAIGCPRDMANSPDAKCKSTAAADATLAKALAPEDIRPGDFVTPLYVIAEIPSFWWCCDAWTLPLDEPVRIRFTPSSDGAPLKVQSVCVPFVLTKTASGEHRTLDLRTCQLARLHRAHGRRDWKAIRKAARKASRRKHAVTV